MQYFCSFYSPRYVCSDLQQSREGLGSTSSPSSLLVTRCLHRQLQRRDQTSCIHTRKHRLGFGCREDIRKLNELAVEAEASVSGASVLFLTWTKHFFSIQLSICKMGNKAACGWIVLLRAGLSAGDALLNSALFCSALLPTSLLCIPGLRMEKGHSIQ